MRNIFKDAALQSKYDSDGYVCVSALEPPEVDDLLVRYNRLPAVNDAGFFTMSFLDASHQDYKRETNAALADIGERLISRYLADYVALGVGFITKKPGRDSTVAPHQDLSHVDEKKWASMNIWFPLVDTTHENGALYILRGSHRLRFTIRGVHTPNLLRNAESALEYENLDYLPLKAGEAVIFDNRVVHRSPANTSDRPRIAVTAVARPREAELLHFRWNATSRKIEKYAPPADYMLTYSYADNTAPHGSKLLGTEDFDIADFTPKEITATLAEYATA